MFWENGFKSIAAVATANPTELVPVLMQVRSRVDVVMVSEGRSADHFSKAQPNKVKLGVMDEQKYKEKLFAKANIIAESANRLWRESACRFIPKGEGD